MRLLLILWLLLAQAVALTSPPLSLIPPQLQKGINLSHWFTDAEANPKAGIISDTEMAALRTMGFTYVRLPIDSKTWKTRQEDLKTAINRLIAQNLAVLISPFGEVNQNLGKSAEPLIAFWKEFAPFLAQWPADKLFVQLANEPDIDSPEAWGKILEQVVKVVRGMLPAHTLITATPLRHAPSDPEDQGWSVIKAFVRTPAINDKNIIYGLTYYNPFFFTHQGATWSDPVVSKLRGLDYPPDKENIARIRRKIKKEPERWPDWFDAWLDNYEKYGKNYIAEDMKKLTATKRPILITEFGVFHVGCTPEEGRVAWLQETRTAFEKAGFSWCLWDYAAGFGLFEGEPDKRVLDKPIAQALGLKVS